MKNTSGSSYTNLMYGGTNQINQGNTLNDNSSIVQNSNQIEKLIDKLKMETEKISDVDLKEETFSRVDTLELLSKSPDHGKLERVKKFFMDNAGTLTSVASLALQIISMIHA